MVQPGMRTEFEILIRKKVPYWTDLVMGLMTVCLFFLFLLYLFMGPADKSQSSDEMKVAYYILVVPEWLKEYSFYSFFGFLVLVPIYGISKLKKPGMLRVHNDFIMVEGGGHNKRIDVNTIERIELNEVTRHFRRPREVVGIIIVQKPMRRTRFLLKDYD